MLPTPGAVGDAWSLMFGILPYRARRPGGSKLGVTRTERLNGEPERTC